MAVLIGGHQRSGTTMLKNLFNSHPEVVITGEFGNFMYLDKAYSSYSRLIWRRWLEKRNAAILDSHPVKGVNVLKNGAFILRYLQAVRRHSLTQVDAESIEAALLQVFPGKRIVGDKHPDYVFVADRFIDAGPLNIIFIYRDPRDVANSTFKRAQDELRASWPDEMRSAKDIAERWVYAIKKIEKFSEHVFSVRYEDFVQDPVPALDRLGDLLGLDPAGFNARMIRTSSIGKFRHSMTDEEISQILEVAGPTMQRLGYSI